MAAGMISTIPLYTRVTLKTSRKWSTVPIINHKTMLGNLTPMNQIRVLDAMSVNTPNRSSSWNKCLGVEAGGHWRGITKVCSKYPLLMEPSVPDPCTQWHTKALGGRRRQACAMVEGHMWVSSTLKCLTFPTKSLWKLNYTSLHFPGKAKMTMTVHIKVIAQDTKVVLTRTLLKNCS